MNQISQIGTLTPSLKSDLAISGKNDTASFADQLKKVIGETNELQLNASELATKFASGEIQDIHDVMIAAEKANVSFELVMEIRNKLIEAYREMMRMQI